MDPLTVAQADLLGASRRAVMATIRFNGRPRLVPCVFAGHLTEQAVVVYTAVDDKRKSVTDPLVLGRVRDIQARPEVSLLVDRWSEDWSELAWLRLDGRASLVEPGGDEHRRATRLLRDRYPQYADHALERRPIIRVEVESATGWSATG